MIKNKPEMQKAYSNSLGKEVQNKMNAMMNTIYNYIQLFFLEGEKFLINALESKVSLFTSYIDIALATYISLKKNSFEGAWQIKGGAKIYRTENDVKRKFHGIWQIIVKQFHSTIKFPS